MTTKTWAWRPTVYGLRKRRKNMMKSRRISFWLAALGGGWLGCLFFHSVDTTQGIEVLWTGLSTTDRWADPNNWQSQQLPGLEDNIEFFGGQDDWSTRQQTVTIDAIADANELVCLHLGWDFEPFHQIYIEPGALFSLHYERIDQNQFHSAYRQTGGRHVVSGDFIFSTSYGDFEMTGGEFEVNGTLWVGPDKGTFTIAGGELLATNLALGYKSGNDNYAPSINFGANALISITGELSLEPVDVGEVMELTLDCPLYLQQADFINRHNKPTGVTGTEQMHLVFTGSETCELEVGGGDYGANENGFTDNFAIDILQIGDPNGGQVRLVDQIDNCPDSVYSGAETLYVNTLRLGQGAVLDLNGLRLYFNELEDQGGQFINGSPRKIGDKFLEITWPNGREKLVAGQTYTVTWQTEGNVNEVRIEYSLDDGLFWSETVPANVGNLGSYKWQAPNIATEQARMRIQDANEPDVFDVSDEPFRIWFAGSLKAWGRNNQGQCSVPSGKNYVAIAAGGEHSIALKGDGSLTGWGSDSHGQRTVPGGTSYTAIVAGENHSLALKDDGALVGWGDNGSGQTSIPPDPNIIIAIAAGGDHSLALRDDGILLGWGDTSSGQATVPAGNDYIAMAAGQTHSLVIKSDGTVVGWGDNTFGQLDAPVPDSEPNEYLAIAAGEWHSIGLRKNGTIVGWGSNVYDQLEIPIGNDFTAIAAGAHHNVALRSDGTIVAWGRNTYNQAVGPDGNGFFAVAAGRYHSLALRKAELVLLQPNGGEAWIAGNTYPVNWHSIGDINTVIIEYTTDDGQNWSAVDPVNAGNTGSYDWTTPKINSNQCRVRITDAAASHISDAGDELFTIYQCTLETDLNGDCLIDLLDLALLAADWLACGNPFDPTCQP
jgi:Regulator of Chromosome Condensation (RCC1) repeat protein